MGIRRQQLKKVGFWAPPRTKHDDVFGSVLGTLADLAAPFPRAEDHVDPNWSPQERYVVLAYVEDQRFVGTAYRGWSNCRFCFCQNGTRDFHDDVYVWPEGFGHYIREHNVKPPVEFIQHVLRRR